MKKRIDRILAAIQRWADALIPPRGVLVPVPARAGARRPPRA